MNDQLALIETAPLIVPPPPPAEPRVNIYDMKRCSPWFDSAVWEATHEINYPVWVQHGQLPRRSASRKPVGLKRWALIRNTMPVTIPDGWPTEQGEVLLEISAPDDGSEPAAIYALWYPSCGYSVHVTSIDLAARRTLSEEAKQSMRRKSLRRRMEAKNPIFAEAEIDAAFALQPDHYGGIRP